MKKAQEVYARHAVEVDAAVHERARKILLNANVAVFEAVIMHTYAALQGEAEHEGKLSAEEAAAKVGVFAVQWNSSSKPKTSGAAQHPPTNLSTTHLESERRAAGHEAVRMCMNISRGSHL